MKKIFKSSYYLIIITIFLNVIYIKAEPIFVYEHVRHGARGPASEYQSLFNNKTFYDEYAIHWEGDGELTLKGKMQHYILGIRNRYKYPNLINYSHYNPEEILIHSTNLRRVKESAYNQLLGMYYPIIKFSSFNNNWTLITKMSEEKRFYYPPNYEVWKYKTTNKYHKIINEAELSIKILEENKQNNKRTYLTEGIFDINEINKKQGTNISILPFESNRTFFKRKCLNHKKYINYNHRKNYQKVIKGLLEKKYGNQLQNFFEYQKKEWLYGIHHSFSIIDHYISNYEDGKDLRFFLNSTEINKEDFYKTCKKVYDYWLFHIFCDKKTCVMESSKLMEDLITYMDKKINDKNYKINMVLDFGHDVTVGPMQLFMYKAFDVDYTICSFSCNIYFELHKKLNKDNKERYYVRYYVDDDLRLNIPYGEFKKNVIRNIWTNKEKDEFCRGNIIKVLHPKLFLGMYIILIFGFILICSYVFNQYYKVYIEKDESNKDIKDDNNKKKYYMSDGDVKLLSSNENTSDNINNNIIRKNSKKKKICKRK